MDTPSPDPPPADPDLVDPNLFPESNTEPTSDPAPLDDADASPLCLHCLQPVDPLLHVCPTCSHAVGQFTSYLPFESIRWETEIWGNMWHQIFQKQTPLSGKIIRLFCVLLFVPILLLGLLPRMRHRQ